MHYMKHIRHYLIDEAMDKKKMEMKEQDWTLVSVGKLLAHTRTVRSIPYIAYCIPHTRSKLSTAGERF